MEGYYKKNELINRAWTDELIRKFLGEPDIIDAYKDGYTVKNFKVERVEAVEQSEEFQSALREELERKATILKKRNSNLSIQRWKKSKPRTIVQKIKTWREK